MTILLEAISSVRQQHQLAMNGSHPVHWVITNCQLVRYSLLSLRLTRQEKYYQSLLRITFLSTENGVSTSQRTPMNVQKTSSQRVMMTASGTVCRCQ